jgi:hypothetical protein
MVHACKTLYNLRKVQAHKIQAIVQIKYMTDKYKLNLDPVLMLQEKAFSSTGQRRYQPAAFFVCVVSIAA